MGDHDARGGSTKVRWSRASPHQQSTEAHGAAASRHENPITRVFLRNSITVIVQAPCSDCSPRGFLASTLIHHSIYPARHPSQSIRNAKKKSHRKLGNRLYQLWYSTDHHSEIRPQYRYGFRGAVQSELDEWLKDGTS